MDATSKNASNLHFSFANLKISCWQKTQIGNRPIKIPFQYETDMSRLSEYICHNVTSSLCVTNTHFAQQMQTVISGSKPKYETRPVPSGGMC